MSADRTSLRAAGARSRAVVLLAVVTASLAACSDGAQPGADSLVAVEQAQAEAAAEVADVQAAIDRQVEAADAQRAAAQAAADKTAREAAASAAAAKATSDRAAAEKAAAAKVAAARPARPKAAAAKVAVAKPAPPKAAGSRAAKPVARPPGRTATRSPQSPPRKGSGKVATRPVPPPQAVASRPPGAASVSKPVTSGPGAAVEPAGGPQGTFWSVEDLDIVVAPGGTVSASGDALAAAGCQSQDFHAGDRVLLTTASGALVREAVLPACHREVVSAPSTAAAVPSPRFQLTLPEIAWRSGDAWVLQIGARSWPVTASALSAFGWSIAVTAEAGVTAGPPADLDGG